MSTVALLAHGGPGAAWQALVTVIAVLLAALFVLVVLRVVKVAAPGDLILPMAGAVVIGSLAPTASDTLSDGVGWAIPLGVMALVGLLSYAYLPEGFPVASPYTAGIVAVTVLSMLLLHTPLSRRLHTVSFLDTSARPVPVDAVLAVTAPDEGATVPTTFDLVVDLTGASIGPAGLTADEAPADAEELGQVRLLLNGTTVLNVAPREDCTAAAPCTQATFPLELPAGTYQLFVEFTRWDGVTFVPAVFDSVGFTVAG